MKSVFLLNGNQPSKLTLGETQMPEIGEHELLVRVVAAGVTPTELLWYPTTHTRDGGQRQLTIPGHEFSGVVEKIGALVEDFAPEDEVFGMNDWFEQGASAEYCVTTPARIAKKPLNISHVEAAAVPISALTAWQALFVHGKLKAGERLLVHGGAGAVGTFVIQLAKLHGAEVIATCAKRNMEFLRSLKVDQAIDYESMAFEEEVSDVDVVFDAVGGETLRRSWSLLNPGGRLVTIATDSETTSDDRVKKSFFIVEPDHRQLSDLSPLLNAGYVRVFVGAIVPLSQATRAYEGKAVPPGRHGKAVLVISEG